MDIEGDFDAVDSKGLTNIDVIRLKAHDLAHRSRQPYALCMRLY